MAATEQRERQARIRARRTAVVRGHVIFRVSVSA